MNQPPPPPLNHLTIDGAEFANEVALAIGKRNYRISESCVVEPLWSATLAFRRELEFPTTPLNCKLQELLG
jgi:hypothetical protein